VNGLRRNNLPNFGKGQKVLRRIRRASAKTKKRFGMLAECRQTSKMPNSLSPNLGKQG
jgi:hypothetical protein